MPVVTSDGNPTPRKLAGRRRSIRSTCGQSFLTLAVFAIALKGLELIRVRNHEIAQLRRAIL
jgi:hypothetical protein